MASTVEVDDNTKVLTIAVDEDITVETADELNQRIMDELKDKFGYLLQLDLTRARYMDSYGIGWLARLRQFMLSRNGSVVLVNLSAAISKTLQISGFLALFTKPTPAK